ncbi:50S ribosomal protein L33 [endosymbiont of Pachyrhynchus infernalis]|uniref:50S ribosomal protein L33 n=1 Tax=endosymbiont of Pachyrhynchus infernalis TaxID=1971488 RepID=UPI000DC6EFE1|nr:50S ribosomal protein L33 [endosymbiont of Pachyrhynchus infernalis]BBA84941.1 50S ribosomal protein L33 [endosymbiont of Pachyrhynchus infernalis]
MSKKKLTEIIKLISSETKHFYTTTKSKKIKLKKIKIKKFDPIIKKHVIYNEYKINKNK